ncbi:unknown [Clostridium sp. CAG:448]|nr:unknown [Clostridium sp. CAG:448]
MHSVVQLLQLALQLINLVKSGKVQFVEQLIGCNRYRVGHFEIRHIGTDLHIGRDFHDIRIQPQIFSQSGQCKTDHHRAIPVADHFAVGNLHIGEDLILKEHTGQHGKRHVNLLLLAVDLHRFILSVFIGNPHGKLSALSDERCGIRLFSVQGIGDLHSHRHFFIDVALVVDILPCGIPNKHTVPVGISLITLDILDSGQIALVIQGLIVQHILQMIADNQLFHSAVRTRNHIDRFALLRRLHILFPVLFQKIGKDVLVRRIHCLIGMDCRDRHGLPKPPHRHCRPALPRKARGKAL